MIGEALDIDCDHPIKQTQTLDDAVRGKLPMGVLVCVLDPIVKIG